MSREIEFRALHTGAKEMLQVGDLFGTTHPLDCCKYAMDGQPVVLMQYTGIKDKNGVKVFEGDVCQHPVSGEKFLVRWWQLRWVADYSLGSDNPDWQSLGLQLTDKAQATVIGNIHQHPHLLEGE